MAEPTIRPLYPTDLLRYASFIKNQPVGQGPEDNIPSRFGLLELLAPPTPLRTLRQGWISLQNDRITGLLVAKAGPGLDTWEIDQWFSPYPPSETDTSGKLLERLCEAARSEGIQKIFLYLNTDSPLIDVAKAFGFYRYTGELLYRQESVPQGLTTTPPIAIRPRVARDHHALFRLYCGSVPAQVRQVEGLTMQEWRGAEGWQSRYSQWQLALPGGRRDFVVEDGDRIVAWLISYPRRGRFSIVVHLEHFYSAASIISYAISLLSEKKPAVCTVREYQMEIISALVEKGFQLIATKDLMVKMLTVRVEQPAFRPVRAWGGPSTVYSVHEFLAQFDITLQKVEPKNGGGQRRTARTDY